MVKTEQERKFLVALLIFLKYLELQILNLGNELMNEVIDMMVMSPCIATFVQCWRASNDIALLDHKRVDFVMDMEPSRSGKAG